MPSPPAPVGMAEIDPELSASTGLTNDVSGRLAIFEAKATRPSEALSAQATPIKEDEGDVWAELDVEDDDYEIVEAEAAEADLAAQRDAFVATLKGSKGEIKNQIGERLYHAIHKMHGDLAGKLTGMFLEASESSNDLALLVFSDASLRFHCEQALKVLNQAPPALTSPPAKKAPQGEEPSSPVTPDAPGAKRSHSHGGPQQYPYNGKRAKTQSSRPFFAEITDDSGKRTRVPCRYDSVHKMYVPTGGRDVASGAKKVGTRDKTPEDLQALELGETDEDRLRARQKQIDIGKNTDGFKALMTQGMSGRALQDTIGLPYITEEGCLEKTLKCSKKRYDGYLRMWKRKLYEFSAVQRMDFSSFPPISEEAEKAPVPQAQGVWSAKAPAAATAKPSGRKQGAPTRHTATAPRSSVVAAASKAASTKVETKRWADMC